MDNKIFTISVGSNISAFLEKKKNDWKETHHNVNSGFIALHFVILVMEKFKLIIRQDEGIVGQDFHQIKGELWERSLVKPSGSLGREKEGSKLLL